MPGCGKSTVGKKLSKEINYDYIDMDDYIVTKFGESISDIFARGEEEFRRYETTACMDLGKGKGTIISTGGGVVKIEGNMDFFTDDIIIFINRSIEKIIESVDTKSRPLLKDGVDMLYKLYDERINLYKKYANYEVDNNEDFDKVMEKIKEIINNENNVN